MLVSEAVIRLLTWQMTASVAREIAYRQADPNVALSRPLVPQFS